MSVPVLLLAMLPMLGVPVDRWLDATWHSPPLRWNRRYSTSLPYKATIPGLVNSHAKAAFDFVGIEETGITAGRPTSNPIGQPVMRPT